MDIIKSIRNIRAEADASPGKALRAVVLCAEGKEDVVKAGERYIKSLANISEITFVKEKKKLEGEVTRVRGKLSNEGFVSKAPEKVLNEEREKQVKYEEMLAKVCDMLETVKKKLK